MITWLSVAYMAFPLSYSVIFFFGSIFYHSMYGCMFCMFVFNFANYVFFSTFIYSYCYVYVFLLLLMFCSVYSVSLCCSLYCLCVNVYCTTATGCQPNCN